MISLEDAQARVNAGIEILPAVDVAIADARGLVLAEEVSALEAIPPFANTAMDGFAVRADDLEGVATDRPTELRVVGTIAAGAVAERALERGEAMRIMTGAPIPEGADAVIMVELTEIVAGKTMNGIVDGDDDESGRSDSERENDGGGERVRCLAAVPVGNHIRPAGDDLGAGAVVFEPGEVLSAHHIGVLASLGRETVLVHRRPKVGVFSTGDELVVGPQVLAPGQIRDSNRPTLLSLVAEAGFEPIDLGVLRDDFDEIEAGLRSAVERCDAMITSGGVSMGDFDFVKRVLMTLGDLNWMQVAIKPAKPFAFGFLFGTPIFGLPGNPVSSAVSFELFARPAILKMMGRPDTQRIQESAIADEPLLRSKDGKTHFQRVRAVQHGDGWHVRSAGGQGSHQLAALAAANGLAIIPDGDGIQAGNRVQVMLL